MKMQFLKWLNSRTHPNPFWEAAGWLGAAAIVFLVVFALCCGNAKAQLTGIIFTTEGIGRGWDASWEINTCSLFIQGGWDVANLDSTVAQLMLQNPRDTFQYYKVLSPSAFATGVAKEYEPAIWARAYLTNGKDYPLDVNYTMRGVTVDSARGVVASATVDATALAAIDSILSANHSLTSQDWSATGAGASGSGAYVCTLRVVDTSQSPDDTLTNYRLQVFDYSRTRKAWPNTGASGLEAVVNLDNENLTFTAQGNLYYQAAGSDSVAFPAKDTNITVQVYKFAPAAPATIDSTILVFNLPSDQYRVKVTPLLQKEGHKDTLNNIILPTPQYGSTSGSNVWTVTVVRTTACDPELPYDILVFDKDDLNPLVHIDEYWTPDATSTTVDW